MKWASWTIILLSSATASSYAADQPSGEQILGDGRQPQCAVATDGRAYITFGRDNEVYCAAAADPISKFAPPVKVGKPGVLSLGMRRGPRIAVSEKCVVIAAIGGAQGKGKDGDIHTWRSTDGGRTWSQSAHVNDVESAAREGLHALAASPTGEFACAWLDLRTKGTKIYVAISTDGGQTWGKNMLAYESPDGFVCQCCHPSIVYDARGTLHVMWRNALAGDRDMYLCSSRDHGATFTAGIKLGQGSWKLNACPMDGGAFAFGKEGQEYTIWRRGKQIIGTGFDGVDAGEQVLGLGEQPWLAVSEQGPLAVWLNNRGGDLMMRRPHQRRAEKLAENANDPVLAANPSGAALVCWETVAKQNPQIAWRWISGNP